MNEYKTLKVYETLKDGKIFNIEINKGVIINYTENGDGESASISIPSKEISVSAPISSISQLVSGGVLEEITCIE